MNTIQFFFLRIRVWFDGIWAGLQLQINFLYLSLRIITPYIVVGQLLKKWDIRTCGPPCISIDIYWFSGSVSHVRYFSPKSKSLCPQFHQVVIDFLISQRTYIIRSTVPVPNLWNPSWTLWLLSGGSKTLRQPGIEPASIAWKATMLTFTPPTLVKSYETERCAV